MVRFLLFFCTVYESGSVFSPDVLDITEEDLLSKFMQVIKRSAYIKCKQKIILKKVTTMIII